MQVDLKATKCINISDYKTVAPFSFSSSLSGIEKLPSKATSQRFVHFLLQVLYYACTVYDTLYMHTILDIPQNSHEVLFHQRHLFSFMLLLVV